MITITKNWRRLLVIIGAFLWTLTSCQYTATEDPAKELPEAPKPQSSSDSLDKKKEETKRINRVPKDSSEEPTTTKSEEISEEPIVPTNEETTQKPSVFGNWGANNEATLQAQEKLNSVAAFAQTYYDSFANELELISKNGKLYQNTNGQYLDLQALSRLGLDRQLLSFSCDVLLIKGSDAASLEGAEIPSASMGFGIFTASKQPNGNKIMLSSSHGYAGAISEQDYRTLLKKYNQNHGNIVLPLPSSQEYQRILNFIRVYDGRYDGYFVRRLQTDEKYAVVVLSPQSNPLDIKEYILVNDNSFWEVAMSDLEKKLTPNVAVNQELPDFNLNLLPEFNVAALRNDLKADNSDVFASMVYNGLIESATQVSYSCGTAKFCYIVLYSGEKYLGIEKNGIWNVQLVNSNKTALDLMKAEGGEKAAFIILDE